MKVERTHWAKPAVQTVDGPSILQEEKPVFQMAGRCRSKVLTNQERKLMRILARRWNTDRSLKTEKKNRQIVKQDTVILEIFER